MLGFPITASGNVAGGANDEDAETLPPEPLHLDDFNLHFKRTTSLKGARRAAHTVTLLRTPCCGNTLTPTPATGPLLRVKGKDQRAPADGSKGGLAESTVAGLRAVVAKLRQRQPTAQFAVLMYNSTEPDVMPTPANVPSLVVGDVCVEFGSVGGFAAQTLAFLVRSLLRCATVSVSNVHARQRMGMARVRWS